MVGGVWCCFSWGLRVTYKAVEVVTGADNSVGIVAAEASGVNTRPNKWGGANLRPRVTRQGGGWVVENANGSPYASYATTPVSPMYSPSITGGNAGNGLYSASNLSTPPSPYAPLSAQHQGAFPPSPAASGLTPPTYFPAASSPTSPGFTAPLPRSPGFGPPPRKENSLKISGMDGKKSD